jgi:alpha-1,4-digalacturonate transport system permease protein
MAVAVQQGHGHAAAGSGGRLGALLRPILHLVPNLVETPMRWLQRRVGLRGMAWVFLAPNLLTFGLFTFFPIILNFAYAATGGANILLGDRDFVGAENFSTLLSCGNYLDSATCERDLFWRAIFNTGFFVALQVTGMVLISLLTALVLNREIRRAASSAACSSIPCCSRPSS